MRIILANNSDKMQIFKNEEALKALWQVLTVGDSQNENIKQEEKNQMKTRKKLMNKLI